MDSFLEVEPSPGPLATSLEPVADVADAVSPSVVVIDSDEGQGSGVVWDAENGYIVTNNHVVELSTNVDVEFPDGQTVVGTVIGGDPSRDVAVVGVDPDEVNSLVQAVFAPTSEVRVGQLAVAIGGPFGLDQTVTSGVVSAINRVLPQGGSDPANPHPVEMIQTDAPINPGNSGGALADRFGRVIGINTQIRTAGPNSGNVGVGFAIPSDTIVLIARRIVSGESLDIGFLGIQGETPTDGSPGALVTSVVDGSPADDSGLKAGDLIIAVNGKEITSMEDLAAEIKLFRPDERVDVLLLRDGIRLTVQAILAAA
ncbi:MAG: trypsin-like peptidase domain-containing protein [Acidimicrobiaceae bacterium]|nr:trypsin-like peptidase domain-containing protein [Acidimicrobiia bacterium]MCY4492689.1 trypsin-like peptidase domain-containing protein [Acidimicrobiaceae bacterium]